MIRRSAVLGAAALLLALGTSATARPYQVDDLLHSEDFGPVSFDPSGRWLVFERLAPFTDLARFDMLAHAGVLRSRLYRADLAAPAEATPLLADPRPGTIFYSFSQNGSRLAIGRLSGERWQLGIVTMSTGAVRWFDLSPDYNPFYTTLKWLSDDRLVAIVTSKGARPWWLQIDSLPADRLPGRWAATRSGTLPAVTVVGSGLFRGATASPAERRLVLLDTASGTAHVLASGHFLSMAVAPDHRRIALTETGTVATMPTDRPVRQIDGPYQLVTAVYDLQDHSLWRSCEGCDMLGAPVWSSDSRHLAFFARRDGEDWPDAELFRIDTRNHRMMRAGSQGVAPTISEFPDGSARASFGWTKTGLLLFGRPAGSKGGRSDWYATGAHPRSLTSRLTDVSPNLASVRGCTAAMTSDTGVWCLDDALPRRLPDASTIVMDHAILDSTSHPRRAPPIDNDHPTIGEGRVGPADRVEGVELSPDKRMVVIRHISANGVKTMVLASRDRAQVIAIANRSLADVEPARAMPLTYRLADGRLVTSWLYLPSNIRPAEKVALVVIPYPGDSFGAEPPAGQAPGAARFQASAQILAGHGYAVLLPSLPSTPDVAGTPPAFVDGVDRAVDAALATGTIDPSRVVLWGHSFGAYAVAMVASYTNRYAAAIASAGVYDLGAVPGTFGPTARLAPEEGLPIGEQFAWAETGQGGLGVPPWTDPQRYVSASPVYRAGRIATPMLIVAADRDPSPVQQAEQLFSALFHQNKDAELLTYWGEGHVVGSPANVRDLYSRVFTWLDTVLETPRHNGRAMSASDRSDPPRRVPNAP